MISYIPSEDEYRIENETDKEIAGSPAPARTEEGRYTLFETPFETIKQENAIQYQGTEMVNDQEAHVIYLDERVIEGFAQMISADRKGRTNPPE